MYAWLYNKKGEYVHRMTQEDDLANGWSQFADCHDLDTISKVVKSPATPAVFKCHKCQREFTKAIALSGHLRGCKA